MTTIDRRTFVRGTIATTVVGAAGLAVPSAAEAALPVTRSVVIERAWFWVNRNVQYSQGATYPGPAGKARFRTDCSGYVSMCLMLPAPGPNTVALAGGTHTFAIRKANLRKGDISSTPATTSSSSTSGPTRRRPASSSSSSPTPAPT